MNRVELGMWTLATATSVAFSSHWVRGNGWEGPEVQLTLVRRSRSTEQICFGRHKVGMVGPVASSTSGGRSGKYSNDFVSR